MSQFMGFGFDQHSGGGQIPESAHEEELLKKLGLDVARNTADTEVSEATSTRAKSYWESFSAYMQAGFSRIEAFEIMLTELRSAQA